jgi:hypothetical protein
MIHALARKRAEELGERWDKDRLIGRLCQALTVEHEEEIHWRNFGNQKQPDRFPNWVELFLETWEPPDGDGPPPEDGSTDEAAGRAFVDDDAGHPYDRGR